MHLVYWSCLLAALSACANSGPSEHGLAGSLENDFGPACASLGHKPGTDAYQTCMSTLLKNESSRERAVRLRDQM